MDRNYKFPEDIEAFTQKPQPPKVVTHAVKAVSRGTALSGDVSHMSESILALENRVLALERNFKNG